MSCAGNDVAPCRQVLPFLGNDVAPCRCSFFTFPSIGFGSIILIFGIIVGSVFLAIDLGTNGILLGSIVRECSNLMTVRYTHHQLDSIPVISRSVKLHHVNIFRECTYRRMQN